MQTKDLTLEGGRSVTITRPVFNTMPAIARDVETLLAIDTPGEMLGHALFMPTLRAAFGTTEDFEGFIEDADFEEVWEVWEAYLDFGRFEDFLTKASAQLSKRQQRRMEAQLAAQKEQLEGMKRHGLVPKDFSIEQIMSESVKDFLSQIGQGSEASSEERAAQDASTKSTKASSTTSTRPSTAGRRGKSKK